MSLQFRSAAVAVLVSLSLGCASVRMTLIYNAVLGLLLELDAR